MSLLHIFQSVDFLQQHFILFRWLWRLIIFPDHTWDLVKFPVGKRKLQNKWVYRLKEEDGGQKRYKSRLVVKGFAHKKGIDFDEIFSPLVKMTSIRTILSLVVVEDLHLEQLDVKTTFLHGDLEEEIYM